MSKPRIYPLWRVRAQRGGRSSNDKRTLREEFGWMHADRAEALSAMEKLIAENKDRSVRYWVSEL